MKQIYKIAILISVSLIFSPSYLSIPIYGQKPSTANIIKNLLQQTKELALEIKKPIEQELKGGESHSYSISAKAGDYLSLVINQKGIDVAVRLLSPSGKNIAEVDSPNGNLGEEPLETILEADGVYTLEIVSLEKEARPGKYEAVINDLHVASEKDKELVKSYKLNIEGNSLIATGKQAQALPLFLEAFEIRKKVVGENHISLAPFIDNLALLYFNIADYAKSEAFVMNVIEIRKKNLGENHPDTISSIGNLAILYSTRGEYKKAENYYLQVVDIFKKIDKTGLDTAVSLNNLAALYAKTGEYDKAESIHNDVLELRKKLLGENDQDTAFSFNNLAEIYRLKGELKKSEVFHIKALEIRRKLLGNNNVDTTISINNLGGIYLAEGEYSKAEPLYVEALEIRKKTIGDSHPDTAYSLNNLANLYQSKGDYNKAEPLYSQALEILKKTLGDNHPLVASSTNNLATVYRFKGDYDKAEPLYAQAVELGRKVLGNSHPNTAFFISNLAELYLSKGEYDKAEPLFAEALEIRKKTFGDTHPDIGGSLSNLARLCEAKKDYGTAESLYSQVLSIYRRALGDSHPETATCISRLARIYNAKGDYRKAIKFIREANEVRENELSKNLIIGSEKSKQIYLQKYQNETDFTLSLQAQNAPNYQLATKVALTQVLRRKGRALDVVNQNIEALRKRSNSEDIALLDKLLEKKLQYSNFVSKGLGKSTPQEYQNKLKSLQEEIENIEYKISQTSKEFSIQSQPISLQTVQEALSTNATLVEFASYRLSDPKAANQGERHYIVYLLDHEGEPKWAELGQAEPIDRLVDQLREKLKNKKSSVEKEIKPLARKLDKLVMQPVRNLAPKGKRLLLAPDGKLNLIPFEALVDQQGKFLLETYPISYLTSGRDLLRLKTTLESKETPVIIGNPDFGKLDSTSAAQNTNRNAFSDLYFPPLKATEVEAKAIKGMFPDATLLLEKQATEQALISLNAPLILHIATHGFFLKEEDLLEINPVVKESTRIARRKSFNPDEPNPIVKLENPLLRSGIALAGANLHQEETNGIFTALKATGLNLWGTKIVVLSACDTGVGEVKTGDGVYGLRRALVLAGSETQIMSLWPISDNGTKDLMISYYSKLKKGMGRSDALRQVQLELLKAPKYNHPFYWASFVQSGQWEELNLPQNITLIDNKK